MRGPKPKSLKERQRRNKATTTAKLVDDRPIDQKPRLGDCPDGDGWSPQAVALWDEVWSSPMRGEYLRADMDGLRMLVVLVDKFWKTLDHRLEPNISRMRQAFGLTPIDRRRLQWEVERVEGRKRRPAPKAPESSEDPRNHLKAI
jgi:hypothetical protein